MTLYTATSCTERRTAKPYTYTCIPLPPVQKGQQSPTLTLGGYERLLRLRLEALANVMWFNWCKYGLPESCSMSTRWKGYRTVYHKWKPSITASISERVKSNEIRHMQPADFIRLSAHTDYNFNSYIKIYNVLKIFIKTLVTEKNNAAINLNTVS